MEGSRSEAETKAFADAVEEGIADAENGRVVPYDDVHRWVASWGTDRELPPPAPVARVP